MLHFRLRDGSKVIWLGEPILLPIQLLMMVSMTEALSTFRMTLSEMMIPPKLATVVASL